MEQTRSYGNYAERDAERAYRREQAIKANNLEKMLRKTKEAFQEKKHVLDKRTARKLGM